jgi:hypothetical protein
MGAYDGPGLDAEMQDCAPPRPIALRPLGVRVKNGTLLLDMLVYGTATPEELARFAHQSSADASWRKGPDAAVLIVNDYGRRVHLGRRDLRGDALPSAPPSGWLRALGSTNRLIQVYQFSVGDSIGTGNVIVTLGPGIIPQGFAAESVCLPSGPTAVVTYPF